MKVFATAFLLLLSTALPAQAVRHMPSPRHDVEVPATFTFNGVEYGPNDDGLTATAVKAVGTPVNVTIADTASYLIDMGDATYGWDFPVTHVNTWFCRNNTSLRTITLGKNLSVIGGGFLRGCSSLSRIYCRMTEPAILANTSYNFRDVNTETCTLIVPVGSLANYTDPESREAMYWRDFAHIIESNGPLFEQGDVNGDGIVSGADVTALYNVLLDDAVPDGDGDVNGDGVISGADVTTLYNILLN